MKCPKCDYLGFETGDRCKNCGYDFSLIAAGSPDRVELDLDLRRTDQSAPPDWLSRVDPLLQPPEPTSGAAFPESAPALSSARSGAAPREGPSPVRATPTPRRAAPLFPSQSDEDGDEPLIQLPVAPRPPLAVRRTPETARRPLATSTRRLEPDSPPLLFEGAPEPPVERPPNDGARVTRVWDEPARRSVEGLAGEDSTPRARAAAAAIDLLTLGVVDLVVVYLTLRMAGLTMDHWLALPATPLAVFLLLIKLSYFCAFTAVGGQTIGKMATHIRVVSADDRPLDAASALRRTLIGLVSAIPLGVGFLPALLGPDRRALHDRIARTRVIALRSA